MSRKVWLVSSALRRQERPPLGQHIVQVMRRDPHRRQRAHVALVVHRDAERPRPHLGGHGRRVRLVEDQRQVLPLLRRLALDVDEMREVRPGSNTMTKSAGRVSESCAFSPGPISIASMVKSSICVDEVLARQVDAGAPEDLAEVFPHRQRLRIVRRDPPHPRIDGEHHLDHLVERRLVGAAAQRAVIGLLVDGAELVCRFPARRRSRGTARSSSSRTGRAARRAGRR